MHRRPRLFCAAERSALPGGGVVLCGVIRLCGTGRSALCGGAFCLARWVFPGLLRAVALRPEPAGRRCGARAGCRFRSEAAAGCGSRRSLRSAGRFSRAVFVVVRRFLLPASCFPPPASCFPPSAVETGRTVKNSGKHPEKGCFPFGCRSEQGGWRMGGGTEDSFACPARRKFRPHRPGSPFAARPSRQVSSRLPPPSTFYLLPFTFHFRQIPAR